MEQRVCEHIHPGIITIQAMLRKIDRLRLPLASRRDVESILVRQVGKEIDRALPWQSGHGRRTAAISLLIGQAVGLTPCELHDLKLAALLHDVGLLMLPTHLVDVQEVLEPNRTSPYRTTLGSAPRSSNLSPSYAQPPSSSRTITNDGMAPAIPTALEAHLSLLERESYRSPTRTTPSKFQAQQILALGVSSHSEFLTSRRAPNSIRS